MKILHDGMLKSMAKAGMIDPFFDDHLKPVPISRGVSAFGYDATLGTQFRELRDDLPPDTVIDPLQLDWDKIDGLFTNTYNTQKVIQPGTFVLGHSVEYFRIPDNVIAFCLGKSTYARFGIIVNVTPLEPGWEGQVTIEISNLGRYPFMVHAGMGITQFVFLQNDVAPIKGYKDRGAKYLEQRGVVLPRVKV